MKRRVRRLIRPPVGLLGVCLAAAWGACGGTPDAGGAADRIEPVYDTTTGRLNRLAYDADGDGVADTWGYMDGTRVVRVEADENGDGRIDRWEYYREPPAGGPADGAQMLERVERATRRDGRISRWEHFEAGVLVRVEEDTRGDGRPDKWETYVDGRLSGVALDTLGRGRPDRRLIYRADGGLDRIETDPDDEAPAPSRD